jgi:glycosyltransferase involved in cell wall biosynthesis
MTKGKKILFIVSRLPINTETGDRLRVYHFIKKLRERGHQIDVLGFVPPGDYKIRTDIESLCNKCVGIEKENLEFQNPNRIKQLKLFSQSFFKGYPYRVWQWYDEKFIRTARQLVEKNAYDVVHFSVVASAIAFKELNEQKQMSRFVFDLVDSLALSLKSAIKREHSFLWPFRYVEFFRLRTFEQQLVQEADKAILISERDKKFLGQKEINIIPNGIEANNLAEVERDIDLLFVGNMAAKTNIDAARWFAKSIMPKLVKYEPSLQFFIAGVNPSEEIKKLQNRNITVSGYVQDINEYYRRARLFVCPMRRGAGQKNKILEAMINNTPVISTTEGNIGIDAPENAIAIADNAKEFAEKILILLEDSNQRNQLAEKGRAYARENFSWEKSVSLLEQCYEA